MTRLYLLAATANIWVLLAILTAAFVAQFTAGEAPCPLCVLQRVGMMLAALGPAHILLAARRGELEARDVAVGCGVTILGSAFGAAVAARQVLLHILPNDPGFGAPILGYHLYTWALIAFACNIVGAGIQMVGLAWFRPQPGIRASAAWVSVAALAMLLVANVLSVVAEAGFAWTLPADPTGYRLFQRG